MGIADNEDPDHALNELGLKGSMIGQFTNDKRHIEVLLEVENTLTSEKKQQVL